MEIEAKMKVEDHDVVRAALNAQNAKRVSRVVETNHILDTADQSLRAAGRGLRVRVNRDMANGSESTVLTVKGALQPGVLKSREEHELLAANAPEALQFFQALGFAPAFVFQKQRETWELLDCKVELDELPKLGLYVEIEGPDESTVLRVRELLNLADRPLIKKSYVALLLEQ